MEENKLRLKIIEIDKLEITRPFLFWAGGLYWPTCEKRIIERKRENYI
jgi:hypothetical protein